MKYQPKPYKRFDRATKTWVLVIPEPVEFTKVLKKFEGFNYSNQANLNSKP